MRVLTSIKLAGIEFSAELSVRLKECIRTRIRYEELYVLARRYHN